MQEKFIDVENIIKSKNPKLLRFLPGFILGYIKRIIHQNEINDFISRNKMHFNADFADATLAEFKIKATASGVENIPKTGPVILVMNHPLGGMDAVALISLLKQQRPDVKFIVNDILLHLDNFKDLFIGVNKIGKNNGSVRQQIQEAFQEDHALCVFPAGLVSRKIKGEVKDLDWKRTFVRYARKYKRDIVPIHIEGELSPFFYRLSKFRKFLRIKANIEMLYLADELYRQKNKTIKFTIGTALPIESFQSIKSDYEVANLIKNQVYQLNKK
jgi:putative hemolysin